MSELVNHLSRLTAMIAASATPPRFDGIAIVELGPHAQIDDHGILIARATDLTDVAAYESRFDELLAQGPPWLNLSCQGILNARLIVTVEAPRTWASKSERTSVNYSGPPAFVLARGWEIGLRLVE